MKAYIAFNKNNYMATKKAAKTTKKTSKSKKVSSGKKHKSIVKRAFVQISFEILGRYFPDDSGKDSPELREAFGLDVGAPFILKSEWKKAACEYLTKAVCEK